MHVLTQGIHYIPSQFLSSQHSKKVITSSVTSLVNSPFNNSDDSAYVSSKTILK